MSPILDLIINKYFESEIFYYWTWMVEILFFLKNAVKMGLAATIDEIQPFYTQILII